jgi:hypothetical protein
VATGGVDSIPRRVKLQRGRSRDRTTFTAHGFHDSQTGSSSIVEQPFAPEALAKVALMETIQISNETRLPMTSDSISERPSRSAEGMTERVSKRAEAFYHRLNGEEFRDFTHPVSMAQIEVALAFLDRNFSQWDEKSLADWEYVLPAIHQLFPDQKVSGYTAKFSPAIWAQTGFGLLLWLSVSLGLTLTAVCAVTVYLIWKN